MHGDSPGQRSRDQPSVARVPGDPTTRSKRSRAHLRFGNSADGADPQPAPGSSHSQARLLKNLKRLFAAGRIHLRRAWFRPGIERHVDGP